jgi:hypothetical protein
MTSPSSNAGESKPLSVDLASTDCMAESLSEADGGRRWPAAMEMLENWLIGQSGPIVGISFSQEEAAKLTAAASVIARKAEKPEPFVVRLFEEAFSPSLPVVHGEGGEDKNHSFNLGSSGDGPESLSSSGGGVE